MQEHLGKERAIGARGTMEEDKSSPKLMRMARIWRTSNRSAGITAVVATELDGQDDGGIGGRYHVQVSVRALREHWGTDF